MGFLRIPLLALCLGLTLAACRYDGNTAETAASAAASPGAAADQATLERLSNREFSLSRVNGAVYGRAPALIGFGENLAVFGRVCNNFRGPGELSGGVLTVKNAAVTKKACLDEDLAALENLILKMLESGAEVSADASSLSLKRGGDALVFEAAGD